MKSLEGRDLICAYDGRDVLRSLSLSAAPGQVLGLIGPNGVGKTTLLRALARLMRPRSGTVLLGEDDLWRMTPKAAARDLAMTPQDVPSWPLTVEQAVALGRAPHRGWLLPLTQADHAAVAHAMERAGLVGFGDRRLNELSGGEQKRVVLARALCQEPAVLLLDEPTAFLDLKYQTEVLELMRSLAHDDGLTVVASMHDLNQAALYADRLALLVDGELLAIGEPRTVLTAENLSHAYGVRVTVADHPVFHTPLITPLVGDDVVG